MLLTAFNGMITILMAKFMMNDVPHYLFETSTMRELKVMHVDERGATGPQLHYIAILSSRLKISEPVVKGFGEAGRMIKELEAEEKYRKSKRLRSVNPKLSDVVITEIADNITAHIPDIRATAELSRLSESEAAIYGLEPGNWLWFNRLINQSGIPRVGTLLLDKVLEYCKVKNYSIVNQVSAYGDIKQKDLEAWYMRKGFVPVDKKQFGNTLLKWVPR